MYKTFVKVIPVFYGSSSHVSLSTLNLHFYVRKYYN